MAEQTQLHSTWHRNIQGLKQSTREFYGRVEAAVKERDVPGVKFSTVEHKEGGLFSAARAYLRVQRGEGETRVSLGVGQRLKHVSGRSQVACVAFPPKGSDPRLQQATEYR